MDRTIWFRRALSACLSVAVFATYSMVALAAAPRTAAELTVYGTAANGEAPFVMVNGEAATSGRSVFSTSVITTPETAGAVINLGKLGKIEVAPNSALVLSFDDAGINGDLSAGKLTVLGASQNVNVKTADGTVASLGAGESVTAAASKAKAGGSGGAAWWIFAAVLGGAAVAIAYAATRDNDVNLGGGGVVVSPTR